MRMLSHLRPAFWLLAGGLLLVPAVGRAQQTAPAVIPAPPTTAPAVAPVPETASDVIIDRRGNELPGQIIEITPSQVLYRTLDADPALPPTVLPKDSLFMVRFANGTKEVFVERAAPHQPAAPSAAPKPGLTESELYHLGRHDALKYHNYSGAFWGTYTATVLTIYGGPIVGLGVSVSRPHPARNARIEREKLQYPSYVEGYGRQAQSHKLGSAAKGFGAGIATWMAIIVVAVASFAL